jgi:hypothetical protein
MQLRTFIQSGDNIETLFGFGQCWLNQGISSRTRGEKMLKK